MRPTILLSVLLWLGVAVPVLAGPSFVIGVEPQPYLPYYTVEDGQYQGFAREILDAFAQAKGYTFTYSPLPIKRLQADFVGGNLDFKFPDNPEWAGDIKQGKTIIYSDAVAPYTDGVMVLPANKGKGLPNLKNMGTVLGFTPWAYMDAIKAGQIKLSESTKIEGLLKMAASGRVDGAYFNPLVVTYYLKKEGMGQDALVFDPGLPNSQGDYMLASIKHPDVITEFNEFLKTQSNLVEQLKAKYNIHK